MFKFVASPVRMADTEVSTTPASPPAATQTTVTPSPVTTHVEAPQATTTEKDPTVLQVQQNAENSQTAYKIPDAYKDKPWASKIKTEDDLWKQLDSTQSLIGKKTVAPDFKTAKPDEIEAYFAQTRPATVDEYQFNEKTDPEFKTAVSETLMKNGVSSFQANAIIKDYQALESAKLEDMFSPEKIKVSLQKTFGDKWETVTANTRDVLKASISPEDYATLNGQIPNQYVGLVYRIAANIAAKHGLKPENSGAHTEATTGTGQTVDITAVRADLRAKLTALTQKPGHTVEEKQKLIDQLSSTYKNA